MRLLGCCKQTDDSEGNPHTLIGTERQPMNHCSKNQASADILTDDAISSSHTSVFGVFGITMRIVTIRTNEK